MPGEASQDITNFILSAMQENELDMKQLTSFCADNAPVNFGGPQHHGQNNVFHRLIGRTTHLIPCRLFSAHLAQCFGEGGRTTSGWLGDYRAQDQQSLQEPNRKSVELKRFCAQLYNSYLTLPTHTPTRWTT